MTTTIKPYEVITSEEAALHEIFGAHVLMLEVFTFNALSRLTSEYTGGSWEFRRYRNNAIVMAFPDDTVVTCISGNQRTVNCTIEALSIVAWMMAVSAVGAECNNGRLSNLCHDLYFGVRDMILGRMEFIINYDTAEWRRPTEEEAAAYEAIPQELRQHPHYEAILEMLD